MYVEQTDYFTGPIDSGTGMMVTEGDPVSPATLITLSNEEEKAAVCMALEWLLPSHEAAAKCTDSQLRLRAIQKLVVGFFVG